MKKGGKFFFMVYYFYEPVIISNLIFNNLNAIWFLLNKHKKRLNKNIWS